MTAVPDEWIFVRKLQNTVQKYNRRHWEVNVGCRFSDKAFVLNTDHKLCPKKKKTRETYYHIQFSFIFEAERIILSLHRLQASSQLFPKRNVDQVESAEKSYKQVRGLENVTCGERTFVYS